jgi:tRNA dimethylallyltransferase
MMEKEAPPLLVILGPTASGKTSLGLVVAETLGGEIISADAFAVYRGLDIGTDKPSPEARRRVRHHLVDVADPKERFSAGAFADLASAAIDDITHRDLMAVVVGGTLFYIRALLEGLFPAPPRDATIGARLAEEWLHDPSAVFRQLQEVDEEAARRIGPNDSQRVLRALEVFELTGEALTIHWRRHQTALKFAPLLVAPEHSRSELYARIDARVERLFASGLVEEVERILASRVPVDAHALRAIGYHQVVELLQGSCDLNAAVEDTKRSSRKFAKRQLTWLRSLREGTLHWVPPVDDGGAAAVTRLWEMHTEERRET